MKKSMLKSIFTIAMVLFLSIPIVNATTINDPSNGEINLYKIVNKMLGLEGSLGAYTKSMNIPQVSDDDDNYWQFNNGQVIIEVRYAGYDQELGLVDKINKDVYKTIVRRVDIINGIYKDGLSYKVDYTNDFVFVEKFWNSSNLPYITPTGIWYSDDRKSSTFDHFVAFDVSDSSKFKGSTVVNQAYIIAWEDLTGSASDRDYNDLVCLVLDIKPTFAEEIILNADPSDSKVGINWKAISEKDVLGYNIYRARGFAGKFEKINDDLIQGKGSIQTTVEYEFVDTDVTNGIIYQYKIEEVGTEGLTLFHGPVKAWPMRIYNLAK